MDKKLKLKEKYLKNGIASLSEREALELFLFYAVQKENVQTVCNNLLNSFGGSLNAVFSADIDSLCKVEGVSRNTAALIHLLNDVSNTVNRNNIAGIQYLNDSESAKRYAKSTLGKTPVEKVIVITLGEGDEILGCSEVASGTVNLANIELVKIVKCILRDRARAVIISHNHPCGSALPSSADKAFTAGLYKELRRLGVELKDHIVVGSNGEISMANDRRFSFCFS